MTSADKRIYRIIINSLKTSTVDWVVGYDKKEYMHYAFNKKTAMKIEFRSFGIVLNGQHQPKIGFFRSWRLERLAKSILKKRLQDQACQELNEYCDLMDNSNSYPYKIIITNEIDGLSKSKKDEILPKIVGDHEHRALYIPLDHMLIIGVKNKELLTNVALILDSNYDIKTYEPHEG